jgi:hypothetical protein
MHALAAEALRSPAPRPESERGEPVVILLRECEAPLLHRRHDERGRLEPAWRATAGFSVVGFRRSLPSWLLRGNLEPESLSRRLCEEVLCRPGGFGIELVVRAGDGGHRLDVHLLLECEDGTSDAVHARMEELLRETRLVLQGCQQIVTAPIASEPALRALVAGGGDDAQLLVPAGRPSPAEEGTMEEMLRVLMDTGRGASVRVAVTRCRTPQAVDALLRDAERAQSVLLAQLEAATQVSRDSRTWTRHYSEDHVQVADASERLRERIEQLRELRTGAMDARVVVARPGGVPRPLGGAVHRALGLSNTVHSTPASDEQRRMLTGGPLEALSCPLDPGAISLEPAGAADAARWLTLPFLPGEGLPGLPLLPAPGRPAPPQAVASMTGGLVGVAPEDGMLPVRIGADDLARHVYVVGKTGVGKSTLLRTLLIDLAQNGEGVGLLDPHGDLFDEVRSTLRHRSPVVFDPTDPSGPGLDPMRHDGTILGMERAVESLTSMMFQLYPPEYMGPMFDRHSRSLLIPLAAARRPLGDMSRLAHDESFRTDCLKSLTHGEPLHDEVRLFWTREFPKWGSEMRGEMASYTISKYDLLLKTSAMRRICDPTRPQLDLEGVLRDGRVLLARLPEGVLGPMSSWFAGMVLVDRLRSAVFARAGQAKAGRRPFTLFLDEFQNFLGGSGFGYAKRERSLAQLLSESRKFGLRLVLANQYLAQMDDGTREALLGNVGSLIAFRTGAPDARLLIEELGDDLEVEDFVEQPLYRAFTRLLVDGSPTRVFTLGTVPPEGVMGT